MPRPTATQVRIAIRRHLPAPAPVTVEGLGVKEWAEIAVRMGKYSYKHTANREDYLFTDNRGWCYTGCQSARFKTPEAALAAWWQSRTGRGE